MAVVLWGLSGLCVLAFSIGSWLISDQFVYGEGHEERPIPLFFGLYMIGWVGLVIGMLLLKLGKEIRYIPIWILVIGIAARLFLVPSNLILENDCYRYVLDGECVKHLVNPYTHAPDEIAEFAPGRLIEELESPEAQLILSRIGYPEIPTIYPPLAQATFAIGAILTPWHWRGQRLVFLALDIGTMFLVIFLLKRLGKPLSWCLIYAWNPLIIKELANSAHLDSLVGFSLLLLLIFLERWHKKGSLFLAAASGVSLAAAVLAKLYPLVVLPICVSFLWGSKSQAPNKRWLSLMVFIGTLFGVIILSYIPFFMSLGMDRITEGLRTYSAEWVNNEGAFFVLSYLTTKIGIIHSFPADRIAAHILTGLLALTMSVKVYKGQEQFEALTNCLQVTLLGWFLLLPAVFPWYAIGLIAVSTINPKGVIVVLSGVLGMYYLLFMIGYREYPEYWRTIIQLIEHGLIWAWVLFGLGRMLLISPRSGI